MLQKQNLLYLRNANLMIIRFVETLNIVDSFAYLGVIFMYHGSFENKNNKLLEQGRKAMYSMLRKSRSWCTY